MIKITNIEHGWLTLTLNDGKKEKSFQVSYLDDFISSMRNLLSIKNNDYDEQDNVGRIYFDGEGHDLYLTAIRECYGDNLYIVWEQYEKEEIIDIFQFKYEEFCEAFEDEFSRVSETYYKNFDWDTLSAIEEELTEWDWDNNDAR